MKKFVAPLIGLMVLVLSSCNNPQSRIDDLRGLEYEVTHYSEEFTGADWEDIADEYEVLCLEIEEMEDEGLFTDAQLQEIGELEGRLHAAILNRGIEQTAKKIHNKIERAAGYVNGVSEGIDEDAINNAQNDIESAVNDFEKAINKISEKYDFE